MESDAGRPGTVDSARRHSPLTPGTNEGGDVNTVGCRFTKHFRQGSQPLGSSPTVTSKTPFPDGIHGLGTNRKKGSRSSDRTGLRGVCCVTWTALRVTGGLWTSPTGRWMSRHPSSICRTSTRSVRSACCTRTSTTVVSRGTGRSGVTVSYRWPTGPGTTRWSDCRNS